MSLKNRLKVDFQKLSDYEKKLRLFAKEVDLKSQEARKLGKKEFDKFTKQVLKKREELEDKVQSVVEAERKKINARINDFLNRLLSASQAPKKPAKRKSKKSAAKRPLKKAASPATDKAS